jgi:hypothetical protein
VGRWILALTGLAASAYGCLGTTAFACGSDGECVFAGQQGRCEDIGFCSFPDIDCPSKQRFGEHAGGGLSEQCVPESDDETTGTTDDGSTDDATTDPDTTDGTDETGPEEDMMVPKPDIMPDPCGDYAPFTEVVENVPFEELSAIRPECTAPSSPLNHCLGAASDWCEQYGNGCYSGGVGVIEATLTHATVVCISNLADMYETTATAMLAASNISPTYLTMQHRHAQAASNAWCKSMGYAHGFGPMELDKNIDYARVLCMPEELADNQTFSAQQMADSGCPVPSAPHDAGCSTAAYLECLALPNGYNAGYGPHGFNGQIDVATCLY